MMARSKDAKTWEFGDFQTPPQLARCALNYLTKAFPEFRPDTVIEPTCGVGSFLLAAADAYPDAQRLVGLEIECDYVAALESKIRDRDDAARFDVQRRDFFATDWSEQIEHAARPILVVGNPPWVTSSDIGRLRGGNLPEKSNFQKYSGLDAVTGKSNFDISEWMLLRHVEWLSNTEGMIAMLCKTSVARKLLRGLWKSGDSRYRGRIIRIDALRHFGASVDACFFVIERVEQAARECPVFDDFDEPRPREVFGFSEGVMLSDARDFARHKNIIGSDPNYTWRSGIKHDCSKVMELKCGEGRRLRNGLGEEIELEASYLYPLLKSSDVGNGRLDRARLMAVVTQRKVGESTDAMEIRAPRTWDYLQRHADRLDARGSIIYRGKPRFSIFGVGGYTFAPWKVAISGFYKSLKFNVVAPLEGRPVVFDDTIYFLSAYSEEEATFLACMLNGNEAQELLGSMVFWTDKRPITAELLKRVHIGKLARNLGREDRYRDFVAQRSRQPEGDTRQLVLVPM